MTTVERNMYDALPILSSIWSEDFIIIDCNEASIKLLNITDKSKTMECFLKASAEVQPGGLTPQESVAKALTRVFGTGEVVHLRWLFLIDGEEIPMEATVSRITAEDGRYVAAVYALDLRPIMRAGDEARLMLETAPLAISMFDENLNTISCNRESYRLFTGNSDITFLHTNKTIHVTMPETQTDGTNSMEIFKKGIEEAFEKGYSKSEITCVLPDGRLMPAEATWASAEYKGEKVVLEYLVDLTEIKAANELTQKLLENAPIFMEMWDTCDNLIECSQKMVDTLGAKDKTELIKNFFSFSPEFQPCGKASADKNREKTNEAIENGSSTCEWMFLTASGEIIPMESTWVFMLHQNNPRIIAYSHDLRQIKSAMKRERELEIKLREHEINQRVKVAEESSKAKSRFLAKMSHEIRTPITAVLGISEIQLQNLHLPPIIEESFAKIHDSSNVLLGIVNDILDLSKIESGKVDLSCAEYEVASLISDAAQQHIVYLGYKDVKFNVNADENLPRHLIGDALRIKQIMTNVLSNAFKYTQSGTINLSLCMENGDLTITITDTGLGMTPQQLEILYDEYTRFHEEENNEIGTGLGMSIVNSLVKVMNATIKVESEVGKGTCVTIKIPQKLSGTETLGVEMSENLRLFKTTIQSDERKFKFIPEPMPYGKVLVVDDVDANLYVAQGLLAFYDLDIETCDSGYAAIDKINSGKTYDIIFMDQMMPGLNGIQTMKKIRETGYTHPIVALTANALIGQAEELIGEGFDGFLSKPIQTVHLNTVLTRHIRDKQPLDVLEAAAKLAPKNTNTSIQTFQTNSDLIEKLRSDFVRRHKNTFIEISTAIDKNDTTTAHLLAHTIKGSAGLIQEKALVNAAWQIEEALNIGNMPTANQLSALDSALSLVLESIGKPGAVQLLGVKNFDPKKAQVLFDKLAPMLASRSFECENYLEELRQLPESAILVRQIEEFDYELARKNLETLRAVLEV